MELCDVANRRTSCHHFETGFKISISEFEAILQLVRKTPSGYNAQPWKFLLIQDEMLLQKVHEIAFKQDHILECGNLVVLLGDREFGVHDCDRILEEWKEIRGFSEEQLEALKASLMRDRPEWQKREMVIRNCSLAAMSFLFSATEKGYATCPMMGFSQRKLKKILSLEEHMIPILLICLGKQQDGVSDNPFPRKSVKELYEVR